jgi:hypothetical protein
LATCWVYLTLLGQFFATGQAPSPPAHKICFDTRMGGLNGLGRCSTFIALVGILLATTAGALPAGTAPPAPSVFACTRAPDLPRTQVERTFHTEWLVYDFMGEAAAQQPIADAQTVFTIAPVTRDYAGLDAEITVHHHENVALENGKAGSSPTPTPNAGAVELEKPFVIERHGKSWCYADRKPCPARDKSESALLAALGGSVELLVPEPSVVAALDGKASDGTLSIPLSQSLLKRIDLSTKRALDARQHEAGFPALFRYETHSDQAVLVIAGNSGGKARNGDLTVDVAVDQACRLTRFSVTQDVTVHFAEGKSATRFMHTRTFVMHFDE